MESLLHDTLLGYTRLRGRCVSQRTSSFRVHKQAEGGSVHLIIDLDLGLEVCIGRGVQQHVPRGVLHAAERNDLGLQQV